jgi:hypothetical protein
VIGDECRRERDQQTDQQATMDDTVACHL